MLNEMSIQGALLQQAIKQNAKLDLLNQTAAALLAEIKAINRKLPPRSPGQMFIGEYTQMAGERFRWSVALPPVPDEDDASARKFWVSVNGGPMGAPTDLPREADKVPGIEGAVGDVHEYTLRDYDAAGNESGASKMSFTVVDTVPPATPGQMSIMDLEQLPGTPPGPTTP